MIPRRQVLTLEWQRCGTRPFLWLAQRYSYPSRGGSISCQSSGWRNVQVRLGLVGLLLAWHAKDVS